MKILIAEVFFDFNEKYKNETELFLQNLTEKDWIKTDSKRNWKVKLSEKQSEEFNLNILKGTINEVLELSKIESIDYIIITENLVYLNV